MYSVIGVTKMSPNVAALSDSTVMLNGYYAIPVEGDGNGIIFEVDNENTPCASMTVIAADNVFCGGDHTLTFTANSKSLLHFEGAPYVQRSGEYKGMILIRGGEDCPDAFLRVMEVI